MFRPILSLEWKASRWSVLLLTPLCLGLPILILQLAKQMATGEFADPALDMIRFIDVMSPLFAPLAVVVGAAFALAAWSWDHRTNHVYALALPLERWRYALLKMGAGAVLLGIPVIAVLLGSVIAVLIVLPLPTGVHAYPIAFTFRFLLAALIIYAVTFAFAAGTMRTTLRVLFAVFVIFVFGSLLTGLAGTAFHVHIPSPLEILADALTSWPGPFNVFGGSWMLIDV